MFLVIVGWVWLDALTTSGRPITLEKFENIQTGMNLNEVNKIMESCPIGGLVNDISAMAIQTLSLKPATAARLTAELLRKQRGTQTAVPKAFRGRVLAFSEQAAAKAAWDKASANSERREAGEQAAILRDIFGNPFRSLTIDSSFITAKVARLAKVIYDERAFERLPELAAALEQAGCVEPDILGHCREPEEHFLGCWLVDKLNDKA
jgi:hypothetical protein